MIRRTVISLLALILSPTVQAFDIQSGGFYASLKGFLTLGASIRLEEQDPQLIAKANLQPGLCTRTDWTRTNNAYNGSPTYPGAESGDIGDTCNGTQDPDLNRQYVESTGSFNINGDNGNMNFDRGDIVAAAAKLNTSIDASWFGFNLTARTQAFFNETYDGFEQTRFDTSFQPRHQSLPSGVTDLFVSDFVVQELSLSREFELFGQFADLRVGRQRLNWGESTALVLNSINTVNPPDQRMLRVPGFDLSEAFQGVGMVSISTQLGLNGSMEAYYQYEWRPVLIDAPGTFFSVSDILGGTDQDGAYAMLSFGKAPEDPRNLYSSQGNSEDPFSLGSASGRTLFRLQDRTPDDGGEFGIAFRYFAESFNNGTEFAVYFANC